MPKSPWLIIEEDYTKPQSFMWKNGDEYHPRTVENGMYVGKPGSVLPAELSFDYALYDRQGKHRNLLDMEFTIAKIKGKPEDFIFIHIYTYSGTPYLNFAYNELGEWKLANNDFSTIFQSGKTSVKPGTNIVRVEYRYGKLRYFINDVKVTDFKYEEKPEIFWKDLKIEAARKQKTVFGLDKVVLKAYNEDIPFSDDAKKIAEEAAIPKYREVPENLKHLKYLKFEEEGKFGLMNNQGLVLAPAKYDEMGNMGTEYDPIEDGYVRVGINGRYTLLDSTGKEITKLIYDDAEYYFSEGLVAVKSSGKWGFINTKGETVIAPEYTFAGQFSDGLAVVSKTPDSGGYFFPNKGAIDKTGKVVIELNYFELLPFVDGLAAFYTRDNDRFGFIDKTGKVIIPQKYFFTEGFDPGVSNYAVVTLEYDNKSMGIIDKTGKTVIPHQYGFLQILEPNLVYAQTGEEAAQQTWLMDINGKAISKSTPKYSSPLTRAG